jgi:hypothetical protein
VDLDAAPQRPFSGDADWIQCDLHGPDVRGSESMRTLTML